MKKYEIKQKYSTGESNLKCEDMEEVIEFLKEITETIQYRNNMKIEVIDLEEKIKILEMNLDQYGLK